MGNRDNPDLKVHRVSQVSQGLLGNKECKDNRVWLEQGVRPDPGEQLVAQVFRELLARQGIPVLREVLDNQATTVRLGCLEPLGLQAQLARLASPVLLGYEVSKVFGVKLDSLGVKDQPDNLAI